ncbi:hypothetical protein NDU88_003824 [Pleurodeles waltl]|uniref:Uncharacterized protein n=1 Tax=Pleurodeles waltl TaxID=8319 RepID=A0AAV7SH39_PLEWA|nr:hypothetical protein NDU88_003824 [Pleurodeles waltl]
MPNGALRSPARSPVFLQGRLSQQQDTPPWARSTERCILSNLSTRAGCPSNRTLPGDTLAGCAPSKGLTWGRQSQQQDAPGGHAGWSVALHVFFLLFCLRGAAHHKRPLRSGDSATHFLRRSISKESRLTLATFTNPCCQPHFYLSGRLSTTCPGMCSFIQACYA